MVITWIKGLSINGSKAKNTGSCKVVLVGGAVGSLNEATTWILDAAQLFKFTI